MSLKPLKIQLVPTFFFCLRHPSQARPLGTPGIVESGVGGAELRSERGRLQGAKLCSAQYI